MSPVREDEAALSSILGAILLFGLTVSTITTLQVQYVPVWDEKREGQLMDELSGGMQLLQADIAGQVARGIATPMARPLPLAPPSGFSFFTGSTTPGTLEFTPASPSGLTLDAPRVRLEQVGADLDVLSETWQAVPETTPPALGLVVPDVASVEHLRVRLSSPHTLGHGERITVRVLDDDGDYAGMFVIENRRPASDYAIVTQVFSASDAVTPLTQVTGSWKKTTDQDAFYSDALDPQFGFAAVLAAASKPLTLEFTTTMATAAVALAIADAATGIGPASGVEVTPFTHQTAGGRLVAARENQQFPEQRYVLEYGALILEQSDGIVMVAEPDFSVAVAGGRTALAFAVPEFVGVPDAVAGSSSARVASAPVGPRADLQAFSREMSFTLLTEYAAVWQAYFDETLQAAGLTPGTHYTLGPNPTNTGMALQVVGLTNDLTTDDVALTFSDATLAISLLASG